MKPNPGSGEAREQGCTCPVIDNGYGRGAWGTSGEGAIFFFSEGCPLHNEKYFDESSDKEIPDTKKHPVSIL